MGLHTVRTYKQMSYFERKVHEERVRNGVVDRRLHLNPYFMRLVEIDILLSFFKTSGMSDSERMKHYEFFIGEMINQADEAEKSAAIEKVIREDARLITVGLCRGKAHDGVQAAVIRTLRDGGDHEAAKAAGLAVLMREEDDRRRIKIASTLKKIEAVFDKTFWPESFDLAKVKNPDAYREALEYFDMDTPGRGIWGYGPSGGSKSRLAIECAVMAANSGMDVEFWVASDLKAHLAHLATTGEGDRRARIEHFIEETALADVLVLDDVFQTFSLPYGENLRRLLDCFHGILIVTSNFSPQAAAELSFKESSPEMLRAIVRRMVEKCTVFNFGLARKARDR